MRRQDRAVTDPGEIVDILSRCQVLHLAIQGENAPYLLPVSFGMEPDGMTFYIHGAMTGTKYTLLARDNRVGFELDCTYGLALEEENKTCSINYESVMGWGYVDELTDETEKRHALERILRQYHTEDFRCDMIPIRVTRILRLRVQERTAKRRREAK